MPTSIIALLQFYPREAGGRREPTPAMGRIGCTLIFEHESFEGVINLDGVGPVQPGQTVRVPIELLRPGVAEDELAVGRRFLLREVDIVGEGEIKELMSFPSAG